jgi:hypothetical protein
MTEQEEGLQILDLYYADCDQSAGVAPRWSAVRTRDQLTDARSLARLQKQLWQLHRKRKLAAPFGQQVIDVDHPRNAPVRVVLQDMLGLGAGEAALAKLGEYGDVLACKYLSTKYARTRLFMVVRVRLAGALRLYLLVSGLNPAFAGEYIQPDTHNWTSSTIPNLVREMKKGAVYPAPGKDEADRKSGGQADQKSGDEGAIAIHDPGHTRYYPHSLECVHRQPPKAEAEGVLDVIGQVCTPTADQAAGVLRTLREGDGDSLGYDALAEALGKAGVQVSRERVRREWVRRFSDAGYTVSPDVLALNSVQITIRLDEFEVKCPLGYYPGRFAHREEGGYHYLTLRGREYGGLQAGRGAIDLAQEEEQEG